VLSLALACFFVLPPFLFAFIVGYFCGAGDRTQG
jgi:hypothetical protein